MSFQPEVSTSLTMLWKEQFQNPQPGPSTIVPLQMRQYTSNDGDNAANRIFAAHDLLPTASNFDFFDHSAEVHNLRDEFAYECIAQQESGAFHLIGTPGLFNISFRRLGVTINQWGPYIQPDDFGMQIRHVQYTSNQWNSQWSEEVVTKMRPNQSVQLFMSSNDRFFIETDWTNMGQSNGNYWMQSNNSLVITRLSRNPYYVSAHEPWID